MKIKKNIYHILFFDLFFELIAILLVTIGFFLGFDVTINNLLFYLLIIAIIIFLGIITYYSYFVLCKSYYEFTDNSIIITKKGNIVKEIYYKDIKRCEYYRFITLLLGDSKGGKLIVYYLEENREKSIEISFLKRLTKKIRVNNIYLR